MLNAHNTLFGSKPYCLAAIHEGYRQDRQWSDSVGRVVFTNGRPENQVIAKHDMTYVNNVSHPGFLTKVPPHVLSHLMFVPNHPTTPTTTHFHYLLLHWLHHETTLVALFPSFAC